MTLVPNRFGLLCITPIYQYHSRFCTHKPQGGISDRKYLPLAKPDVKVASVVAERSSIRTSASNVPFEHELYDHCHNGMIRK